VKRVSEYGYLSDDTFGSDQLDQIVALMRDEESEGSFAFEERDYHRAYRPHDVADVVFERAD
jgi:hypothetical protein